MRGLLWLAVAACAACSAGAPQPCNDPSCPTGQECLAQRCVSTGSDPVPPSSSRRVLAPTRMALITSEQPGASVPSVVRLGHSATGDVRWFLAFDDSWKGGGFVEGAFLLFAPAPGDGAPHDIPVSVWLVREPWTTKDLAWLRRPETGRPKALGLARARPGATLRLDVTELVRHMSEGDDHGVVLLAEAAEGHGASYFTGVAGGVSPRLEIYQRRRRAAR